MSTVSHSRFRFESWLGVTPLLFAVVLALGGVGGVGATCNAADPPPCDPDLGDCPPNPAGYCYEGGWEDYLDCMYVCWLDAQSANPGPVPCCMTYWEYVGWLRDMEDYARENNCVYLLPTNCEKAEKFIELYNDNCNPDLSESEECLVRAGLGCKGTIKDCFDPPPDGPIYLPLPIPGGPFDGSPPPPFGVPWDVGDDWGDPYDDPPSMGGIDLSRGVYKPREIDLSLPAPGFSWVIARTYSSGQRDAGGLETDTNHYQGWNWHQTSQPQLIPDDDYFDGTILEGLGVIWIFYQSDGYIQFMEVEPDSDYYEAMGDAVGVIAFEPGEPGEPPEPNTYTYWDQRGVKTVFIERSVSGEKIGLVWTIEDPAGNTAWVGHPTDPSDADENGYGSDGEILFAVDPADRRYTYSYSEDPIPNLDPPDDGDNRHRLVEVMVETKTDGAWEGTPTGVEEIAAVEYDYYTQTTSGKGVAGDLKGVAVVTPISDGSGDLGTDTVVERRTYYRYYTDTGYEHKIKYVLGPEGTRGYDWLDQGFGQSYESASDSAIEPYADRYLAYADNNDLGGLVVDEVFFNGDCGCSSSPDGTYEFTYQLNDNFSNTSEYDEGWYGRTLVKRPDDSFVTHLYDENLVPYATVVTDDNPSRSVNETWVTHFKRGSTQGVTQEVRSPASVTGYTHSSGAITFDTDDGLVTAYEYYGGGDSDGFLQHVMWKEGTSGDKYLSASRSYESRTMVFDYTDPNPDDYYADLDARLMRSFLKSTWNYTQETTSKSDEDGDATGSYKTTRSYAYYEDTDEDDPLWVTPETVTVTYPAVTSSKNGSGSAMSNSRYQLKDGRTSFIKSTEGIITYVGYWDDTGLAKTRIVDADTSHGDFSGITIPTGFSSTGSPLHYRTQYTYDPQARPDTTTLYADGDEERVTKNYYSRLEDGRIASLSIPRVVTGGSTTYYGPVGYQISNHAGRGEFSATIAIGSSGTTTSLSAWIDTDNHDGDPILALDVGAIARLSTRVHSKTGTRLTESRVYFDIPSSGVGDADYNYDPEKFVYDEMGRREHTEDATGTITRVKFDTLGHVTERWIGTSFTSWPTSHNLVKTEELEYDDGVSSNGLGGTGFLVKRTLDADANWNTTGDQRVTEFEHDVRGRVLLQTNPTEPKHILSKYDNMGRAVATALYDSGDVEAGDDPTTRTDDRLTLSEAAYDELGRVYKSTRHKITQSTGASADTLLNETWYDEAGRVIKVDGGQLTKSEYDRLGRPIRQFVLASMNDTAYADADDVAGDVMLEESRTVYDDENKTGRVLMTGLISREHDDAGGGQTLGVLDDDDDGTGGSSDPMKFTATDLHGRIQITAMWYDELGRTETTGYYGTYALDEGSPPTAFDRGTVSKPTDSSTTVLVTHNTYNDDGSLLEVEDPMGRFTRSEYDDAGRQKAVISNYVASPSGDDESTSVRYEYEDGLLEKMWADLDRSGDDPNSGDQVTEYVYGVTKGTGDDDSRLNANNMLYKTIYPDPQEDGEDESDRTAYYAYSALGQQTWSMDQAENEIAFDYDLSGRLTARRVTNVESPYDDAVLRIETAYTDLGQVETVTQYDAATSGDVVNQVEFAYDGWGFITGIEQDHNGVVGATGSVDDYEVRFDSAKATTGRNTIRRTGIDYYHGSTLIEEVTYGYTGAHAADVSRVGRISIGTGQASVIITDYEYMGLGRVVETEYHEPDVYRRLYGSNGYEDRMDRFDRITSDIWTKDLATDVDFYHVDIGYDHNSNPEYVNDQILGGGAGFDVDYEMDGRDRLIDAEEGTWSVSAISSKTRQQIWTLDQLGNWDLARLNLNDDDDFTDAGEYDDDRTHNSVNELIGRDTDDNGTDNFTPTYDKTGNLVDDDEHYEYVYDVFGRLVEVQKTSDQTTVAEYGYDGLGQRITWHYDTNADGDVDGDDPTYHFAYDDAWRIVATYRSDDDDPKELFVWHMAGLDGEGGSTYIDSVILRDSEDYDDWTSEADGTLEDRVYYLQNWRSDVVFLLTDDGEQTIEQVRYSAYGVPFEIHAADINRDGSYNSADITAFLSLFNNQNYDVEADMNLDGVENSADFTAFLNQTTSGDTTNTGRGVLSRDSAGSRVGYAGYQWDGAVDALYHVRNRVLHAELGRWLQRDPLGYVDGMGLYEYASTTPVIARDPTGTRYLPCPGSGCGDDQPNDNGGGDSNHVDDYRDSLAPPSLALYNGNLEIIGCAAFPAASCALADSQVQDMIKSARMSCALNSPRSTVTIICRSCKKYSDHYTTCSFGANVNICTSGYNCNDLIDAFLHELTHARQCCDNPDNFYVGCSHAICAEIEAYCKQRTSFVCAGKTKKQICNQACLSAETNCRRWPWDRYAKRFNRCVSRCMNIYNDCKRGFYPPHIVPI